MPHARYWKFGIILAILVVGLVTPVVFADAPTGSGPNDPLRVTGQWRTLAANTSPWFYFDYTGDRSSIKVTLDDSETENVRLAIFTPEQARAWLEDPTTRPIGVGTKPSAASAAALHDLVWRGAFNFPGRFFIRVTNDKPTPGSFRLIVSGDSVALYPTPTPTALPTPFFATPIPVAPIPGKLVFQESSGGNIYTVNGDGTNLTRITYGLDPAWSPDGKQIAFARWDEPAGLFVANADGTNEARVFGAPSVLSPQWSSDGTRLAFTRQKGGRLEETQVCVRNTCFTAPADPHWKIGVIEIGKVIDDTAKNALSDPPCTNHCFAPTWSSDGRYIAFADAGFGILRTDTLAPTRVDTETETFPNPISTLYNQTPKVQSPAWSPDGSQIAFQVVQHDHWEIVVMNADGSNAHAVTRPNPFLLFRVVNNIAPVWSPDGKQILFLSDRNGKWEFFVINADGSGLRQVLKNVTDAIPVRYNFSNERVIDWSK
jgi:hypothetical protein